MAGSKYRNLCLPQECLGEGAGAGGVLLCLGPRYNYAHD
uniref:NADH:ubiquinone oxidoreductase subunit A3 n=1 Tax=Mus musculus TaxID=10090 RepID=D6RGT3_MOUSE